MSLVTQEHDLTRQAKLLQYVNNKRTDGKFNDVTIQAGGQSILANRMVLACYSKYFESMFLSPLKERYQNTIVIKDLDGNALKQVIEYIYTGMIDITTTNVLILLGVADFLQVNDVKKMCFDFMEKSLTVESCLDVVKAMILYNNPSLQLTYQFISDNFDEIAQGDNFKHLSKAEVLPLFTNLDRNAVPVQETSLYAASINWINFDQNRETEFSSLFLSLDLEKFPSEFVADVIAEEPLVQVNVDCLNAVVLYLADKMKVMKTDEKASKILCVGGDKVGNLASEVFSVLGDPLKKYPDLPFKLFHHCVLKVDGCIFCMDGNVRGKWINTTNQVYCLNLELPNLGWEVVASMAEKRCWFGAAVFNGCLVVAGGSNNDLHTNSTEVYKPRSYKWRTIASLNISRERHSLVVQGKKLFAIGGWDRNQCLSSVEQLDHLGGNWRDVKPMIVKRACFATVACNNSIYAIGGRGSCAQETKKSVEKYDIKNNNWSFVSAMNEKRRYHAACVLQGKIYVFGGLDQNSKVVQAIECYNPATDEWTVVGNLEQDLFGHALVAM